MPMYSLSQEKNYGSHFELLKNFPSCPQKGNKCNESVCCFPLHQAIITHNNSLCFSKIRTRTCPCIHKHKCLLLWREDHSQYLSNEWKFCIYSHLPQFMASQQLTLHPKHTQTTLIPLCGQWTSKQNTLGENGSVFLDPRVEPKWE